METTEYYAEIAKKVKERRTQEKGKEYERGFEDGACWAYRSALRETGQKYTYAEMVSFARKFLKFLEAEKSRGKLASEDCETEFWEGHLKFSAAELADFLAIQIKSLRARLQKAREIHALNTKLLRELTQLSID